jgi:Plasmid pRiA4b ORF-3-like protein
VLEDIGAKTLKYIYDFGDGWEHTIKVERLADPEPGTFYPRLTEASGRCPPEDVGGPWGLRRVPRSNERSQARAP